MTVMLSKKLAKVICDGNNGLEFFCPGCKDLHVVWTEGTGPNWVFNGDGDEPTFTPSILVRSGHYAPHYKPGGECWCTWRSEDKHIPDEHPFRCVTCHSFVTNGKIIFLQDCTHELAGQTVDIPDYPTKEQ